MKRILPGWRGLTQLFAVTVLPLTLLLLFIAFGGVNMHQQDMRTLVGERDERAVQSAAAALQSELHHRMATVSSMAVLASEDISFKDIFATTTDLAKDFNGGIAFLNTDGHLIEKTGNDRFWGWVSQNSYSIKLASSSSPQLVFSDPTLDPNSNQLFVIISAYSDSRDVIVAGAFSPETLASETLTPTYPAGSHVTIYLLDNSRRILFVSGALERESLDADHPGVAEALAGRSGVLYVKKEATEHVVAYSPIETAGWALITEEEWEMVISPSLQLTQMAPLVMVPAFILALIAIWFGANVVLGFLGPRVAGQAPAVRAFWAASQGAMARVLYNVAGVGILITGVAMVLNDDEFEFKATFISIGFLAIVIGAALGMAVFGPGCRALEAAINEGNDAEEARLTKKLTTFGIIDSLVVLVTIVAMVSRW